MKYIVIIFFLINLISCAKHSTKLSTQTFEQHRKEVLLAKYAQMRTNPPEKIVLIETNPIKENKKKNPGATQISKAIKTPRDPEEIKIEMDQHIAYFCIKYSNIPDCEDFARIKLLECELQNIDDQKFDTLKCLTASLAKKPIN